MTKALHVSTHSRCVYVYGLWNQWPNFPSGLHGKDCAFILGGADHGHLHQREWGASGRDEVLQARAWVKGKICVCILRGTLFNSKGEPKGKEPLVLFLFCFFFFFGGESGYVGAQQCVLFPFPSGKGL